MGTQFRRTSAKVDAAVLSKLDEMENITPDEVSQAINSRFKTLWSSVSKPFVGRDVEGNALENDEGPTIVRFFIAVVSGISILVMLVGFFQGFVSHRDVMNTISQQQNQAKADFSDAQRYSQDRKLTETTSKDTIESVTNFANKVATLQNAYMAPDLPKDQFRSISSKLRSFFTEDALKKGALDPTTPWYLGYRVDDRGIVTSEMMDPHTYGWVFPGSIDVSSTQGDVSIVWLNKNRATGALYAWVKADFDPSSKKFHNLELGMTSEGRSHNGVISLESSIIDGTGDSQRLYHPGIGQRPAILDQPEPDLPTTSEGWDAYMEKNREPGSVVQRIGPETPDELSASEMGAQPHAPTDTKPSDESVAPSNLPPDAGKDAGEPDDKGQK